MTPVLSVVSDTTGAVAESHPEGLSDRIRRLQEEARGMAREHVLALEHALVGVSRLAAEIADGGEAYPVGARQIARQLVAEAEGRAQTLDAILHRVARA